MFNHIRKVPYVAGDGKGGISYFAGGFSNQFGMETQIVAAMCEYTLSGSTVLQYLADLLSQMEPLLSQRLHLRSKSLECQIRRCSNWQCSFGGVLCLACTAFS